MSRTPCVTFRSATLAVLLVAAGYVLRAVTITQQSLWLDEVYSLIFVRGPLDEAWRNGIFPAQNPHAPAYYLPFWAWVRLAGESDLAARWFSLLASMLGMAALWRVTHALATARVAHAALLLLTLSPFGIWYAQEARQYAQYLASSLLALLFMLRLRAPAARNARVALVGFVVSALLMAYTHFFAVFVLPAYALAGLLLHGTLRGQTKRAVALLAALVLIAIACIPIPLALLSSGRTFDAADVTRRALNPLEMAGESALEFLLRKPFWEDARRYWFVVPVAALWMFGILSAWRRNRRVALAIATLGLGPLLTFWPAAQWVSIFTPKYALPVFAPLLIGLALGIAHLPRGVGAISLALLLGTGLLAHARALTDPLVQREHWRYVAQYLRANALPDDKIVVFADYAQPVLDYHFDGPNELIRFLDEPMAPEAFYDRVQQGSYRNLWLVLAHDRVAKPNHRLVDVATARYPWSYAQYPNNGFIRILGYSLRWRHNTLPTTATSTDARFENGVRLVGYRIDQRKLAATENLSHPPSNWVHVTAYWQADGVPQNAPHARPFVRMVGVEGEWGGELARIPSVFEFDPPKGWPAGAIIESHHDVNLNPVTPPGRYAMVIGLATDDGKRLALRGAPATSHELGEVEIVR